MIDVVFEEHVERAICNVLRDATQRRRAENNASALMSGAAKGKKRNGHALQA